MMLLGSLFVFFADISENGCSATGYFKFASKVSLSGPVFVPKTSWHCCTRCLFQNLWKQIQVSMGGPLHARTIVSVSAVRYFSSFYFRPYFVNSSSLVHNFFVSRCGPVYSPDLSRSESDLTVHYWIWTKMRENDRCFNLVVTQDETRWNWGIRNECDLAKNRPTLYVLIRLAGTVSS